MGFDEAFKSTLGYEGGYVDDPHDPGGKTKFGISQSAYPDADIATLTIEDAKAIYRRDYWDALFLDQVKPGVIAAEIFDTAVNMGLKQAVMIVQRALNFFGENLDEDGIMGKKTLAALANWGFKDPEALFKALNGEQFAVYKAIIARRETSRRYARGWMKRIQSYREAS